LVQSISPYNDDKPPEPITTIGSALDWARSALQEQIDNAWLDARLLLCHVLEVRQEYLILYSEKTLTIQQAADYQSLVMRRATGSPLAYLLGSQPFYDIEVFVSPDVLIPRPETELLVEQAINFAQNRSHQFIVDVGAGSGIIALAMAKHLPQHHITGIDLSQDALDIAKRNTVHLNLVNRVRWLQGNLLDPLIKQGEQVDLIVANLPYITTEEMQDLEVSKHEPHMALDGGNDGLDLIRQLLKNAPLVLKPNGAILMEIGAAQGDGVRNIAQHYFPTAQVHVNQDLAALDRIVSVILPPR